MKYLESIFVYGIRYGSSLYHFACGYLLISAQFVEDSLSSTKLPLQLYKNSVGYICVGYNILVKSNNLKVS